MPLLSRSRPSEPSARHSRGPATLPPYQPLTCALNEQALHSLRMLPQSHKLERLHTHISAATTTLSNTAADINDRYQYHAAKYAKRKARLERQAAENGAEVEDLATEQLEEVEAEAQKMTDHIEAAVRQMIDAETSVVMLEEALKEVSTNIIAGGGLGAPTQSTLGASQFRASKRQKRVVLGDDEDEDEEGEDGEQEEELQIEIVGAAALLKQKLAEHDSKYQQMSMRARYATHNSYIGFKKIVHDANHPGADAPPLPHASTWFSGSSSEQASKSSKSTRHRNTDADDNDESDIEIAAERISLKCPLTLLPMKNPLTSKNCPHSFEKNAILDMINRSNLWAGPGGSTQNQRRAGGPGQERAMKCPVCEVTITSSTLYSDPILIRKIARLRQAAEQHEADQEIEDEDEGEDESPGTLKPSQNESGDSFRTILSDAGRAKTPKVERLEAERLASMVPDTQVGAGDADEDEDDDHRPPQSTAGGTIIDLGGDGDEDMEE